MPANALVQTRIDADIRDRASAVLESMGLTVSDAVRILLTRTANEGTLPIDLVTNSEAYDIWFRAKVREALDDTRPDIANEQVELHFAERRAAARRKASEPKARRPLKDSGFPE
ncbi:DNA-damage-inducible protein J [Mesorhizobium sp. NFR06]|uniref:type II toxin-antitoxin system RelB/DinJ family antitoxin n=1 Tax=Mesorhizobium sp. NFR06 TaxID=1566290 RepID=UPI0008E55FF4|nr:type II toxin-antitoxin system RelB/DinJ family antitoxin [Mesorhizobium sp. NFR06]SFO71768.1 DNA-damage-inducible protein J [Mesorhizobium sp. NFR06]